MNSEALPVKPGTNRHPVDQLANIRATIKTLQDREAELKAEIGVLMGERDSLGGDEFIARQELRSRKGGLDEKKLADRIGDLSAFRKSDSTYIVLSVEPRAMEVA